MILIQIISEKKNLSPQLVHLRLKGYTPFFYCCTVHFISIYQEKPPYYHNDVLIQDMLPRHFNEIF
jgi:hypothetical protein